MPIVEQIQHDSSLGRWRIARWKPHASLSAYAAELWDLESFGCYTRERIPPRTHFDLLINLGDPHRLLLGEAERVVEYRAAWIAGLQERFLDIESPPSSRLMGVQLTPAGASGLLRIPLHELTGRVVELSDLLGSDVRRLRERLWDARSVRQRLILLEAWLCRRLSDTRAMNSAVVEGMQRIVESDGVCKIRELALTSGVSHKHLIALFRRQVGLTPKGFARTVRFNALVEFVNSHPGIHWTDVAHQFGFYDQAHFTREFRDFTGTSPTEFLRARSPEGNTIVVDV